MWLRDSSFCRPATYPSVVPAKAGTQYSRVLIVLLERISCVSGYWVPAFAGPTIARFDPMRPARLHLLAVLAPAVLTPPPAAQDLSPGKTVQIIVGLGLRR